MQDWEILDIQKLTLRKQLQKLVSPQLEHKNFFNREAVLYLHLLDQFYLREMEPRKSGFHLRANFQSRQAQTARFAREKSVNKRIILVGCFKKGLSSPPWLSIKQYMIVIVIQAQRHIKRNCQSIKVLFTLLSYIVDKHINVMDQDIYLCILYNLLLQIQYILAGILSCTSIHKYVRYTFQCRKLQQHINIPRKLLLLCTKYNQILQQHAVLAFQYIYQQYLLWLICMNMNG
eukprot:TRINITY_DN7525_c0_g1_i2.p2 TRINITY_DN7525_c0_g1~~TRINITY_DN7525_c0_g1_i2.p2  ORF type:complete len:232 (+),score=-4.33 TRINITY_DN7525_c0_g1_i2:536-1231(+)